MSYLVLARKWRPAIFEEIIGQDHVTRTLRNAIRMDRVAHAFLFTGARGVGKTTAARVLAKALQCDQGPIETPCGDCSSCKEITEGVTCLDVIEIDGASNRGINEIRELRDSVAYAPQRNRYKIYIIDEVHMLTQEAFNALLKTLEEPPSHVKFIFATTEPQKIPVTILSRCQRYDFKRVSATMIRQHLEVLLDKEGVHIEADGLRMIARESEGSVRDALSLLDRVISFVGEKADAKAVADCLGIADREWLMRFAKALVDGDASPALGVIADAHHYGYDLRAFTADVLMTIRDVIVIKVCGGDSRATELSDVEIQAMFVLGEMSSVAALQRIFQLLLKASDDVARSGHPRLVLEMAAIRACSVRDMQTVPELMERLEEVVSHVGQGGELSDHEPVEMSAPAPAPATAPMHTVPTPAMIETPHEVAPLDAPEPTPEAAPEPAPEDTPSPPSSLVPESAPESPIRETLPPDTPAPGDVAVAPLSIVTDGFTRETWASFVAQAKADDPLLASMLESVQLVHGNGPELTFAVEKRFYVEQLKSPATRSRLERLLSDTLGSTVSYTIEETAQVDDTISTELTERKDRDVERRRQLLLDHPVTQAALKATDGNVVDLRIEELHYD
jgi:DNA polymerase-3 subunit gamma/tau